MIISATTQGSNQNRKKLKLGFALLATAIIIGGCSSFGAPAPKTDSFVLSEDVQQEVRNMEPPIIEGQLLPLSEELDYDNIMSIHNDKLLFNKTQGFYMVNIESGNNQQPVKLLDEPVVAVSKDGKKALYGTAADVYILDIDSGESNKIKTSSEMNERQAKKSDYSPMYFADAQGRYIVSTIKIGVIAVTDTVTDKVYTIKLADYLKSESFGYNNDFKVYENELYMFASVSPEEFSSLIKINLEELRSEKVIQEMEFNRFELLSDGTILLDGQMGNEDGLFLYNPAAKSFTTVVSVPVDPDRSYYAFSLSLDEKHILIDNFRNDTVEIAEFKEGKLLNKKVVLKGYMLPAIVDLMTSWDMDRNQLYIKLAMFDGSISSNTVSNIMKLSTNE
ncbi:hypothetical protein [Paenibacillus yanchengensis]|uniref:Lipoprotein n=1 Tax=Paenibacillus yanchengensis TaxID=2035833 RepID=A0ABW4YF16_9BACL